MARDGFRRADVLPGSFIIAIGVLGTTLSGMHYIRNRHHAKVLGECRATIESLRGTKFPHRPREFPRLLAVLWLVLPILIAVAGVFVVVLAHRAHGHA